MFSCFSPFNNDFFVPRSRGHTALCIANLSLLYSQSSLCCCKHYALPCYSYAFPALALPSYSAALHSLSNPLQSIAHRFHRIHCLADPLLTDAFRHLSRRGYCRSELINAVAFQSLSRRRESMLLLFYCQCLVSQIYADAVLLIASLSRRSASLCLCSTLLLFSDACRIIAFARQFDTEPSHAIALLPGHSISFAIRARRGLAFAQFPQRNVRMELVVL